MKTPTRISPKSPPFRVLTIGGTTLEHFRTTRLHVRHYGFATGRMEIINNWSISSIIHNAETQTMSQLHDFESYVKKARIDGIIAQVKDLEMAEQLAKLPIPVVDLATRFHTSPFPTVNQDYTLVGQQAADHLLNCGGAVFGFWGHKNTFYSDTLKTSFRQTLQDQRPGVQLFEQDGNSILKESGNTLIRRMEKWLKNIPLPAGIFTVVDTFGLHLMQAAQNLGLRVPEDVAILSAGDDSYWVDFGNIPLSSIHYNAEKIGFEAASLLDEMMSKGIKTAPHRFVNGSEVIPRRSTDVLFLEDQAISKAVAYIRAHASKNIYVGDAVKASGVSRTSLHLRMKKALGRSVLDEIRNARIRHVQMLLRSTKLQLTEIAELCDFPDTPALHVMFRRVTGDTPAKYRAVFKQH